ncbi:MAG: Nucleoside-diphosphate-sugar epimerase [Shouchella clausii]|jgi:uncharacterized protein YbjT (DUF2867 family)
MKVLIIGANGQIGKQLVEKIEQQSPHEARAMVRSKEQLESFQQAGVDAVLANLEGPINELAEAAKGCDAIVFTAGSGGHTGADKTMMIDLDGAIKSMEAAKQAGVSRFVIVSAIGVHRREKWMASAPYYSAAKYYADEWLRASGLDYTIIRPGGLTNERGKQKIKVAAELQRGDIPREDVANAILAVLDMDNTIGKSFDLVSGEEDIEAALSSL